MRGDSAGSSAAEAKDFHAMASSASVCAVRVAGDVAACGGGATAELSRESRLGATVAVVAVLHTSKRVAMLMAEAGAVLA